MSRITVEKENIYEPHYDVCVGWDNPLQTFFLQVYDMTQLDEDLQLIDWQGLQFAEIPTVADLEERIAKYGKLSEETKDQLTSDYEYRSEPTPLQKKMHDLFEGGQ